MHKSGIANLPLHNGDCPRWLFPRMKKLAGAISEAIIDEYGAEELLNRLANPYFFQSLGCVIGFDWHSSGLTTTTLGALKESVNQNNLGIKVAGGKGKVSKSTLEEIDATNFSFSTSKIETLKYASRMSAKVDNALVQDGYHLYHHSFIFDEKGNWAVVQQGMNSSIRYARRYHWLSGNINFVEEPHNAICCDSINENTLDLTSNKNNEIKKVSVDLVNDDINHLTKHFNKKLVSNNSIQKTLYEYYDENKTRIITMSPDHLIVDMNKRNIEMLQKAHEMQPRTYEELAAIRGVGAKAIRSLALISELIYGAKISWNDPVKYSFAHGGKDGIPFPVDKKMMDNSTEILQNAIKDSKIGDKSKINAIKRLNNFICF